MIEINKRGLDPEPLVSQALDNRFEREFFIVLRLPNSR